MGSEQIRLFRGEYRFLSNFYPCVISLDGYDYTTIEHAYQAAKTQDPLFRERIRDTIQPGRAKAMGKSLRMSKEEESAWRDKRLDVMEGFLRQKFSKKPMRDLLLHTRDAMIVEENWWGDTFWGVCEGKGENHLGKIIMKIREDIKSEKAAAQANEGHSEASLEEKGDVTIEDLGVGPGYNPHILYSLLYSTPVQTITHAVSHIMADKIDDMQKRLKVVGDDLFTSFFKKNHADLSTEDRVAVLIFALTTECVMSSSDPSFQQRIDKLNEQMGHE